MSAFTSTNCNISDVVATDKKNYTNLDLKYNQYNIPLFTNYRESHQFSGANWMNVKESTIDGFKMYYIYQNTPHKKQVMSGDDYYNLIFMPHFWNNVKQDSNGNPNKFNFGSKGILQVYYLDNGEIIKINMDEYNKTKDYIIHDNGDSNTVFNGVSIPADTILRISDSQELPETVKNRIFKNQRLYVIFKWFNENGKYWKNGDEYFYGIYDFTNAGADLTNKTPKYANVNITLTDDEICEEMKKFAKKIQVDKNALLGMKAKKPTSPKGNSINGPSAGGGGPNTVFKFSDSSSASGGTPSLNPSEFKFTKVGILNCGNSCYFNTAIQQLIHSPVFIDFLKNMDLKIQISDKDNNIISLLLGIYNSMKTATTSPIESEVIYNQIQALPESKIANIMNGNQQDIDNFMNYLFEDIEKAIFKYTSQNIIENLLTFLNTFANNIITTKTCSKCKYATIKYEYSSKCEILKILNQSDTDTFNAKLIKLQTDLNNEINEQKKNGNTDSGPIRNKYRETYNSPSELKGGKQVIVGTKANDADFLNMKTIINNSKLSENLESECKNCCESTQRPSDVITNKTPNLLKFYINRNHYTNDGNNIKLNDSIGNITQPLIINTKIYNLINAAIHKNYSAVGGHYAALCKNVIDKEWNIFNDEIVLTQEVKDNDKNEEYNNYNSSMNFFIYETNNIDKYNAVDLFIYLFLQNEYREFLLTEPYKSYFTKNKDELKNFKDTFVNNTILHIVCDNADNFVSENVIIDIYIFLVYTIECDTQANNNNGETPFMLASNSPLSPLFIYLIQNATAETLLKSNTKNNKTPVDKINCDLNKEISKFSVDDKENLFNAFIEKKNNYEIQMQQKGKPTDKTIKNVVESGNTALILFRKIENFFKNSRNKKDKQNKYLFSEKLQQFNKCINQQTEITDYFKKFNFVSVNTTFIPDRITLKSLINSCKNIVKICYESSETNIDWLKHIPIDFIKDLNPSVGVKNTVTSNTSTASNTSTGNATSNTKIASKTATGNTKVITGQKLPPPPPVVENTVNPVLTPASTSTATPTSITAPIFIQVKFKGIEIQGNVEIINSAAAAASPISLSNCITKLTSTQIDASFEQTFVIELGTKEIADMDKLVREILTPP